MVIFDPRKEDREVAADIRQMVADLNVALQYATSSGLAVRIDVVEGMETINLVAKTLKPAAPYIDIEIVRPL